MSRHPGIAELTRDQVEQGSLGSASEFSGSERVRVGGEESLDTVIGICVGERERGDV